MSLGGEAGMIACVDVDYRDPGAVAACVVFAGWDDERPVEEVVIPIEGVQPYEPGRLYRRELPCLLAVLGKVEASVQVVIIDGYVWIGDEGDPGLGAHLHEAMGRRCAVIGVAKTKFARARAVEEIRRGVGRSPLYVTSAGMDLPEAARRVERMQGPFRIPTLLKQVDQLARGRTTPA